MKASILASVIWLCGLDTLIKFIIIILYTFLLRSPEFILPSPGSYIAHIIGVVVFFVVPVVNHIGMLFAIRRQNSQLGDAVVSQQMSAVLQRENKVAFDIMIVAIMIMVFLVLSLFMKIIELRYPRVYSIMSPWALTVAFMTSSINPVFYFGRNENLRNAVSSEHDH